MKNYLILALTGFLFLQVEAQEMYWQQELNYTIDVTLNDRSRSLDASLQLEYINHSPDTLHFIWFHLWPNAYKNDKTAFGDQLLENGRTDFYFSEKEQRGYINRLDFRTNNATLKQEDHPRHIDIVKVYLLSPLPPKQSVIITTPFHVKLPHNFSRGGAVGNAYQITQWYPRPAVYDSRGWHPMPYLDQGEFYGEFGKFDVTIHVPHAYIVAATGELLGGKYKQETETERSVPGLKTLRYQQDSVHDFAWFADSSFRVEHDTIALPSGRIIEAFAYYLPFSKPIWTSAIAYIKKVVRFRSAVTGEYPYNTVTAVEAKMGFEGGMEYPTITSISPVSSHPELEEVLEHEIGHNWFYGILASNERDYPWMDEGFNTYYDDRYRGGTHEGGKDLLRMQPWLAKRWPDDPQLYLLNALVKEKNDQPISTPAEQFTPMNYTLVAYCKTAYWLRELEKKLGAPLFDSSMKTYFQDWKFRHPYPDDFKRSLERASGQDLTAQFGLLGRTGAIPSLPAKRIVKPVFVFSASNTDSVSYINIAPAIGYNAYDKLMIGAVVHNFNLPTENLTFFAAPMYAFNSKRITGSGAVAYSWFPDRSFKKIQAGMNGSAFSTRDGIDSLGKKLFGNFYKIAPFVRLTFSNSDLRSPVEKWMEWKTFFIGERDFDYEQYSVDSFYYPAKGTMQTRYINQLSFNYTNYRVLYPHDALIQLQQGKSFYRLNATGNYFFNYAKGGGMQLRVFAAKFGYIGGRNSSKEFLTYRYQPKLTAVRGNEDYTYGNYFIGRNEANGFASQQIMMRDGGLKIRTDLFQNLQGRSDDWVASVNLNSTIPQLFPIKIPVKVFLDAGTYAEAWDKQANNNRFIYVAGLQLSLFKDLLNIYAPLLLSKEFRDNLKTVPEENKFVKRISFSIDVQRVNLRRLAGNKFPF